MSKPLRVLIIDDSVYDCMLLVKGLRRGGFEPRYARVDTADAVSAALGREPWDLVIADYSTPDLGAVAAIKLVREQNPDLPVIVLSDVTGDEAAVATMTAGAQDFVPKDKSERLAPSIARILQERDGRRISKQKEDERRRTEEQLHQVVASSSDVITVVAADGTVRYQSPSVERVLGYRPDELSGLNALALVHADDQPIFRGMLSEVSGEPGQRRSVELRFRHKDGSWRTLDCLGKNLLDNPAVSGIVLDARDITERKLAERALASAETLPGTPSDAPDSFTREHETHSEPFPPRPDTAAQWIGRYRVIDRLGEGGMGCVYKAYDPKLERMVAVKVPRFDAAKWDMSVLVQRFLREARAAAQIRHPNVCPIYDADESNGVPFVVMAFVEGKSLADRLSTVRTFADPADAARLVQRVAHGLKAVHAHDIVHRDLKPANILLDTDGQPLLTDFGLARPEHDSQRLTLHGVVLGTPGYMAPEQAAGESDRIDARTDLYSLSVVLYTMLTGCLPFQGSAISVLMKLINETPPPPSSLRPGLDRALEAIVLKGMARRPDDRYQSAQKMIDALDDWLSRQTPNQPTADSSTQGGFVGNM
jgi:PAS domain S-box-containing protein